MRIDQIGQVEMNRLYFQKSVQDSKHHLGRLRPIYFHPKNVEDFENCSSQRAFDQNLRTMT